MFRTTLFLTALLVLAASAQTANKPQEGPASLEWKLHGKWKGDAACQGNWTLAADGTFEWRHYSPGNNKLSGTWEVRWDALPPTLVLNCKTEDRPELVGKRELKLILLDAETLACRLPDKQGEMRFSRAKK